MLHKLTAKNLYDVWCSECECLEILDFRTQEEFELYRIPGAHLQNKKEDLNLETIVANEEKIFVLISCPKNVLNQISQDKKIENAFVLEAGLDSWGENNYPAAPLTFPMEEKRHG